MFSQFKTPILQDSTLDDGVVVHREAGRAPQHVKTVSYIWDMSTEKPNQTPLTCRTLSQHMFSCSVCREANITPAYVQSKRRGEKLMMLQSKYCTMIVCTGSYNATVSSNFPAGSRRFRRFDIAMPVIIEPFYDSGCFICTSFGAAIRHLRSASTRQREPYACVTMRHVVSHTPILVPIRTHPLTYFHTHYYSFRNVCINPAS